MKQEMTTENGCIPISKFEGDQRYSKNRVGSRTEPRSPVGEVSLWKFSDDGQKYTLYLAESEARDLADTLDDLLAHLDYLVGGVDNL